MFVTKPPKTSMKGNINADCALIVSGYTVVRLVIAAVLLLAASFKGYQLATEPVLETGLFESRWFLIGVVELELFLGLWILSGFLSSLSWMVALICFGIFATVSFFKALSGYASCGCFGRLPVNPWYTASLDLGIVLSLLYWLPPQTQTLASVGAAVRRIEWPASSRSIGKFVGVWLLVGIPAAWAMGTSRNAGLSDTGEIVGAGDIVVLEPATWLNKRFPLLPYIETAENLRAGEWLLVLVHSDCPKCRVVLPRFEQLAKGWTMRGIASRVAIIELPPYNSSAKTVAPYPEIFCKSGRLTKRREWFAKTPVSIKIADGVVIEVDTAVRP